MVLGDSGTGKTTSLMSLDPTQTFIIGADEKSLPFKGWRKNYITTFSENGKLDLAKTNFFQTSNPRTVAVLIEQIALTKPEIKVIVIDTITNLMMAEYVRRIKEKGFEKFNDTALNTLTLLTMAEKLRDDLTLVFLGHVENNYDSDGVLRTSFKVPGGKLVGQTILPESLFTTVLYSEVVLENNIRKYYFITQNNGRNTCKSPMGMFEDIQIPNDLKYVLEAIENFEN